MRRVSVRDNNDVNFNNGASLRYTTWAHLIRHHTSVRSVSRPWQRGTQTLLTRPPVSFSSGKTCTKLVVNGAVFSECWVTPRRPLKLTSCPTFTDCRTSLSFTCYRAHADTFSFGLPTSTARIHHPHCSKHDKEARTKWFGFLFTLASLLVAVIVEQTLSYSGFFAFLFGFFWF